MKKFLKKINRKLVAMTLVAFFLLGSGFYFGANSDSLFGEGAFKYNIATPKLTTTKLTSSDLAISRKLSSHIIESIKAPLVIQAPVEEPEELDCENGFVPNDAETECVIDCEEGYEPSSDGRSCVEIPVDCDLNPTHEDCYVAPECGPNFVIDPASGTCVCEEGYVLVGAECVSELEVITVYVKDFSDDLRVFGTIAPGDTNATIARYGFMPVLPDGSAPVGFGLDTLDVDIQAPSGSISTVRWSSAPVANYNYDVATSSFTDPQESAYSETITLNNLGFHTYHGPFSYLQFNADFVDEIPVGGPVELTLDLDSIEFRFFNEDGSEREVNLEFVFVDSENNPVDSLDAFGREVLATTERIFVSLSPNNPPVDGPPPVRNNSVSGNKIAEFLFTNNGTEMNVITGMDFDFEGNYAHTQFMQLKKEDGFSINSGSENVGDGADEHLNIAADGTVRVPVYLELEAGETKLIKMYLSLNADTLWASGGCNDDTFTIEMTDVRARTHGSAIDYDGTIISNELWNCAGTE